MVYPDNYDRLGRLLDDVSVAIAHIRDLASEDEVLEVAEALVELADAIEIASDDYGTAAFDAMVEAVEEDSGDE